MKSNLRILFVDDEQEILEIFEMLLKMDGHDVVCATNYHDALAQVQAHEFDVVITDYRMPKMHGIYLLDMVKDSRPDLPVIIISAYQTDEMMADASRKGADLVIEKPFDYEVLMQGIQQLMAKAGK